MRGRKPKPTKLKLIDGTRPDRINTAEPVATPGRPDPPTHLDQVALEEWHRLIPVLEGMQVLTVADGSALAIYCEAHSRARAAQADIEKRGLMIETRYERKNKAGEVVEEQTVVKLNPSTQVVNAANTVMLRVLTEFGLTPSSRSRIKADVAPAVDRLTAFLASENKG